MRHSIVGQRREDRARRTILVGVAAALTPVLATAAASWVAPSPGGIVLVMMVSTVVAAGAVSLLLLRVTSRIMMEQRHFLRTNLLAEIRHGRD